MQRNFRRGETPISLIRLLPLANHIVTTENLEMFKKIAAEAFGISDIGTVVSPEHYDKVDSDDYLFHEDGEKIFFLIKSKKDEYCFTNLSFIHVDGDSAVSSKRRVSRYEYATNHITDVAIETAGRMDLDIELKFYVDGKLFSIDVSKECIEQLKDIYKALFTIGRSWNTSEMARENARRSLEVTGSMYRFSSAGSNEEVVARYYALVNAANTAEYAATKRDFSDVFTTYIQR